jgi:hypothetical protein
MSTWHQEQRPVKLFHETEWTVVIDPPNEMRGLVRFATEAEANAYKANFGRHHPLKADYVYILPPSGL